MASTSPLKNKAPNDISLLRQQAGIWLRERRAEAGLSQRALASHVGFEYYTFISQLESGRGKVPSDRYAAYADAVKVSRRDFAITMLRYNDPDTYNLIFVNEENDKVDPNTSRLEERLRLLEEKLAD